MINGFLIINKKKGITSAKVVGIVKHLLYSIDKNQKLGHCGTLDPDGEGVLPIALGRATRLFDFLLNKTKKYYTEFVFGIETDTLDTSGSVINKSDIIPTLGMVENVAREMMGLSLQTPPMYSARNYKGQRAYDLARNGIKVDLDAKEIEIFSIDDIKELDKGVFSMNITCSAGTYIRSIARDMGEKLGTFGTMSYIKRLKSGVFEIKDSVTIEELGNAEDIKKYILPMEYAVSTVDAVDINRADEVRLLRGFSVKTDKPDVDTCKIYIEKELIALGKIENNQLSIKSWLNSRAQRDDAKMVLALGFFDGLHIGHQAILDRAKHLAANGWTYATIFPESIEKLSIKSKKHLFDYNTRLDAIIKYGINPYYLPDEEVFYKMSKEAFCTYLKDNFAPSYLVVGENFRFGKNREGDVEFLKDWFSDTKIKVEIVKLVAIDDNIISTSYIKELLSTGEMQKAQSLLKEPYLIKGVTEKGRGDGKKMGVPTLNLSISDTMFLPKLGVYTAIVILNNKHYKAVVNIGSAPTFDVDKIIIETHIIGDVQLEDEVMFEVMPCRFLREIVKFPTKAELIEQITKDIKEAQND